MFRCIEAVAKAPFSCSMSANQRIGPAFKTGSFSWAGRRAGCRQRTHNPPPKGHRRFDSDPAHQSPCCLFPDPSFISRQSPPARLSPISFHCPADAVEFALRSVSLSLPSKPRLARISLRAGLPLGQLTRALPRLQVDQRGELVGNPSKRFRRVGKPRRRDAKKLASARADVATAATRNRYAMRGERDDRRLFVRHRHPQVQPVVTLGAHAAREQQLAQR